MKYELKKLLHFIIGSFIVNSYIFYKLSNYEDQGFDIIVALALILLAAVAGFIYMKIFNKLVARYIN